MNNNKIGDKMSVSIYGLTEIIFCWISPGSFIMGSPLDEIGRNPNDENQHEVTISRGFWMAKTQITQLQWSSLMGNRPWYREWRELLPVDIRRKIGLSQKSSDFHNEAACFISWKDIMKRGTLYPGFIKKANQIAPLNMCFDLPTEAEWEYACRAGKKSALNDGKNLSSDVYLCENLDKLGWNGYNHRGDNHPHSVGMKQENDWGLCDMHGNIWEWCLDWYGYYPQGKLIDPKGVEYSNKRVLRGGAWQCSPWACRSAARWCDAPYTADNKIGFRPILRSLEKQGKSKR